MTTSIINEDMMMIVSATCVSVFKSLLNSIDVSFLALCFSDGLLLGSCKRSLSLSVQLTQFFFIAFYCFICCLFYLCLQINIYMMTTQSAEAIAWEPDISENVVRVLRETCGYHECI